MQPGTLGHEIARCLDEQHLTLVPGYENHDLKHILLDYQMTPEDEIRMQAFMIGNGNYSIPSFSIFIFGAILLPDCWTVFYSDYQKGRRTIPIATWTLEEYASHSLESLQKKLHPSPTLKPQNNPMKQLTKIAAIITFIAGIIGMLFCLPFLFSSNLADLIGAGFPFLGGAILTVGALIALTGLSRTANS